MKNKHNSIYSITELWTDKLNKEKKDLGILIRKQPKHGSFFLVLFLAQLTNFKWIYWRGVKSNPNQFGSICKYNYPLILISGLEGSYVNMNKSNQTKKPDKNKNVLCKHTVQIEPITLIQIKI